MQGQDLTVRADSVYLKTLSGLRRVHAILRRLDDDFCDPLELRADSALGVPGLLGAVRAGAWCSPMRSAAGYWSRPPGWASCPALRSVLLGESLRLPSVATWWCGEQPALEYAIAHLDRLVVKPTFPNQQFEPRFGRDLGEEERASVIARLRTRPYAYVAQERVSLSQAPSWRAGANVAAERRARLTMRVYAIATPTGYEVMPGGLARIAAEGVVDIVSSQRGGGSKDVWVLADPDAPPSSADAPADAPVLPRSPRGTMNCPRSWSRTCTGSVAIPSAAKTRHACCARRWRCAPTARSGACAREQCVRYGVLPRDGDPTEGLYDDAQPVRPGRRPGQARLVRDPVAQPAVGRALALHQRHAAALPRVRSVAGRSAGNTRPTAGVADRAERIRARRHDAGRRLANADARPATRAHPVPGGPDGRAARAEARRSSRRELEWLLDVGGVSITYRTRYVSTPQLAPVLQLMVFEHGSPRALAFQWRTIAPDAGGSGRIDRSAARRAARGAGGAAERDRHRRTSRMKGEQGDERRSVLSAALSALAAAAGRLSDRLALRHFSLVGLGCARRWPHEQRPLCRAARDALSLRRRGGAFASAAASDAARFGRPAAACRISIDITPAAGGTGRAHWMPSAIALRASNSTGRTTGWKWSPRWVS